MTIRQLVDLLAQQVEKYPDAQVLIQSEDYQSGDTILDELDTVHLVFTQPDDTLSVRVCSESE